MVDCVFMPNSPSCASNYEKCGHEAHALLPSRVENQRELHLVPLSIRHYQKHRGLRSRPLSANAKSSFRYSFVRNPRDLTAPLLGGRVATLECGYNLRRFTLVVQISFNLFWTGNFMGALDNTLRREANPAFDY